MEVIQKEGVKIPNSLLVSGLVNTPDDQELYDFLKQHGSIQRTIQIDLPRSEKGDQIIVEYTAGTALQSLALPYKLASKSRTDVIYHIEALASVYTPAISQSATETYLTELKEIAKLSGKNFAAVLKEELSRITETVSEEDLEGEEEDKGAKMNIIQGNAFQATEQVNPQLNVFPSQQPHNPTINPVQSQRPPAEKTQPALSLNELYPAELQKVVVEHIVKHEDSQAQSHASLRLRPFSGRSPRPNNEVDYETWRSNADFLLRDAQQSDLHKSRKMLESLLSPAIDIVKHLTPYSSPPSMYLDILDSAFGTVEDGDDLFAKFLNTLQNYGEKSSTYLQRLQVMLNTTLRRGGVKLTDLDSQLLKQLCRGCWDNILIAELKLEQRKHNPPSFAELLLQLRIVEDKRDTKARRMKQHFGASRQKVSSHSQGAYGPCVEERDTSPKRHSESKSEMRDLKRQIADLQSQLSRMTQKDSRTHSKKANPTTVTTKPSPESARTQKAQPSNRDGNNNHSSRPKPWYCFRCGEDGHIMPQCEAEPNSSLVASKRKLLREKQLEWDMKNGDPTSNLN